MITKIYSKKNPKKLLNIIYKNEIVQGKLIEKKVNPLSDEKHFIQVMHNKFPAGTLITSHKHKNVKRKTGKTHESLLVFRGKVELSVYDTDKKLVEKVILNEGDCSIIIDGGHSFRMLTHASVYEFKNGPYLGRDKDLVYF